MCDTNIDTDTFKNWYWTKFKWNKKKLIRKKKIENILVWQTFWGARAYVYLKNEWKIIIKKVFLMFYTRCVTKYLIGNQYLCNFFFICAHFALTNIFQPFISRITVIASDNSVLSAKVIPKKLLFLLVCKII